MKGRNLPSQNSMREQPVRAEHKPYSQQSNHQDSTKTYQSAIRARYCTRYKYRCNKDLRWPTSITEREIIGYNRNQTFTITINNTSRHDASSITPEAHTHGQGLLTMSTSTPKKFVQVEGDTR